MPRLAFVTVKRACSKLLLAAIVAAPLALAACQDEATGACVDETCPAGHACSADTGACAPLEPPSATGDLGRYTALALDAAGRRVIATYDATYRNLVLLREQDDGGLDALIVDGYRLQDHRVVDTDSGRWPTLAIGDTGIVHLAWHDADGGELRYAAIPKTGPWKPEVVDGEAADRGRHASLVIDDAGAVHVAYRDATARTLRYAVRAPEGGWTTSLVGSCAGEADCPDPGGEDYGEYAALTLVAGRPRIAFYDRLRGDLKLADRSEDGSWTVTTLDGRDPATGEDSGDVGRFAAVAVDAKRRLGVAYFDASRNALRFVREGGANALKPLTVDDGGYADEASGASRNHIVGQHVALTFDAAGRAVMVYLDATRLVMKRAVVAGGAVTVREDLPGLPPGGHVALAVDGAGALLGAYGPWLPGQVPRTRLERFELTDEDAP